MVRGRYRTIAGLLTAALAAAACSDPAPDRAAEGSEGAAPAPADCSGTGFEARTDVAYRDPVPAEVADPNLVSLDVYVPELDPACPPAPLLVYVHGGSFRNGDKAQAIGDKVELFTGAGFVFASVNYRLAVGDPAQPAYPDQQHDLAAAIAWLHDNANDLSADPTTTMLLGHSAGAFLVALLSTDPSFLADVGVDPASVVCTVPNDTEDFDVTERVQQPPPQSTMYLDAFGTDPDVWAAASPLLLVEGAEPGTTFPDFLLITRGSPARAAGNEALRDALVAAGSDATVLHADPLSHAGVNQALGQPGDDLVTPRLMDFLTGCAA